MDASVDGLLRPWITDPATSGVFTDFDGTLSPIIDDHAAAAALPGAVELLGRLARRYGRVGVLSGRSVDFLLGRLTTSGEDGGSRVILSGLYGLERVDGGRRSVRPGVETWSRTVDRAASEAERDAPDGVTVERKGLTFTLHARQVPGMLGALQRYGADLAARTGLEPVPGKMAVELRPPVDVDKGTVLAELAVGLGAVCYAGDDVGDLPAFVALGRLRASGVSTLAIAARSDESPEALLDAADLVVDGPRGVVEIFGRLAG